MKRVVFYDRVFALVAVIPYAKVATYGQIARLLGAPECARQVGQAMHHAPPELPCHRVVNSVGRLAPDWPQQRERLLLEGVSFKKNGCVDLTQCKWNA